MGDGRLAVGAGDADHRCICDLPCEFNFRNDRYPSFLCFLDEFYRVGDARILDDQVRPVQEAHGMVAIDDFHALAREHLPRLLIREYLVRREGDIRTEIEHRVYGTSPASSVTEYD